MLNTLLYCLSLLFIWAAVFCETQGDSLVHANVLSETEELLQPALLSHKHRQFGTDCCIISNTDSHTVYHTVTVHISDTVSAVAM